MWPGEISPALGKTDVSMRVSGVFTAAETGTHTFSLITTGPSRLYVDDRELVDNWGGWRAGRDGFFGMGNPEISAEIEMTVGQAYDMRIEYAKRSQGLTGMRLGVLPPIAADAIEQAAALAAASDVAVLCIGLGKEWESEGYDRPDMELPPEQVDLLEAVADANPNTVVVLNTGAPITMDWLDRVAAVVQAWYPGQEVGNAIADVLFGDVNPSGRLPQTFPKRLQDNPAYINYPGENGRVHYGEGIFVGYRYYDQKGIEPLFPFGFGLSYTTFVYSNLSIAAAEFKAPDGIRVSVDVTNTGARAGQEVVQLYVRDIVSTLARPEQELKAFRKVYLEPGESQTVSFELGHDALAFYDPRQRGWLAEAGEFEVCVGSSSRDVRARGSFTLCSDAFVPDRREAQQEMVQLSTHSTLKELLDNKDAKAILMRRFPGFLDAPQISMALGMSLVQIAGFAPAVFTAEVLETLDEEFARLR
jgi:beta-glucosidase